MEKKGTHNSNKVRKVPKREMTHTCSAMRTAGPTSRRLTAFCSADLSDEGEPRHAPPSPLAPRLLLGHAARAQHKTMIVVMVVVIVMVMVVVIVVVRHGDGGSHGGSNSCPQFRAMSLTLLPVHWPTSPGGHICDQVQGGRGLCLAAPSSPFLDLRAAGPCGCRQQPRHVQVGGGRLTGRHLGLTGGWQVLLGGLHGWHGCGTHGRQYRLACTLRQG